MPVSTITLGFKARAIAYQPSLRPKSGVPVVAMLESFLEPLVEFWIVSCLSEEALDLRGGRVESVRDKRCQLLLIAQLIGEIRKLRVEEDISQCGSRGLAETDVIKAERARLRPPTDTWKAERIDPPAQALQAVADRGGSLFAASTSRLMLLRSFSQPSVGVAREPGRVERSARRGSRAPLEDARGHPARERGPR